MKGLLLGLLVAASLMPLSASAVIQQNQAQAPGACEQSCRNTSVPNLCAAGGVLRGSNVDVQCAQSRLGVATYTAELTTYGNTNGCRDASSNWRNGVEQCSSGSCTTYGGQQVLGIAHRTFPMGTRMEVCNLRNQICAIATVIDRGPADYLQRRTIDAYSVLSAALRMNCGTVPATYKVLSSPGTNGTIEPSGPTEVGIEAILASQRNGNGTGPGGMTYTAMNTPWGYGYVGTPPPIGSSAYSSMGPGFNTAQNPVTGQYYSNAPISSMLNTNVPTTNVVQTGPPGPPVNFILVQPETVRSGGTVYVSWTSVNMSPNSCVVRLDNTEFATGKEGSKIWRTTSTSTGMHTFTLSCGDTTGQVRQVRDTVTVQ